MTLLPREPPRLSRLPAVLPTGAPGLIFSLIRMLLLRAPTAVLAVPTIMHVAAANGVLVPADGKMLLVMATEVPANVVADTLPPIRVLIVMVARPLSLTPTVIWMLPDSDTMDPALTLLLRADMAGVQLRKLTLMLVPTLTEVQDTALMAVTGKMPAVTPTQAPTPPDVLMADGAQLLRVQLMPSPVRTVSRSATDTVVRPRTSTPMRTVLLMPVLAATVAPTLMAVALVLLATLPTLAVKVLPCVSVALAEIVVLELVEVALPTNTLELEPTLMRVTVPVAAELLAVVVPATLVNALLVLTETFQMLVLTAVELVQSVVVAVTMAAPTALVFITVALAATVVLAAAMAVITVMVALLDMAVTPTATAMATEVAMAAMAATLATAVATATVAMAALVAMAAAMVALVAMVVATAVTVATEDSIESCEIKKTTAKRRF